MRWATATLLALAVLATPGCGGGGSGGSGSGQVKAEDTSAKSDARVTVTALESCFIDTQAYALCAAPGKLDARGVKVVVGSSPAKGEVGVAGPREAMSSPPSLRAAPTSRSRSSAKVRPAGPAARPTPA